jgi:hypothetical protein
MSLEPRAYVIMRERILTKNSKRFPMRQTINLAGFDSAAKVE